MTQDFATAFAACLAFFAVLEGILFLRRSRMLKNAQDLLHLAKRETLETAQISLGNPYPLIRISGDGRVVFINPAAFERFPGIGEQGFAHPVLAGLAAAMGKRETTTRETAFGGRIYALTAMPAEAGGQAALTIYCHDVTERKAYERQLRESREEAEKARRDAEAANQARGDFLANMSHELRTPMNGIIGLSDLLAAAGLKPDHQEMIEAVNNAAHSLLILLNDILDFSKIEAGELTLEAIPFDLRRIVTQTAALQNPVAASKGLALNSAIGEGVPPCLTGDPSRLQQILNNLVGNALKFTAQGSVTLSVGGEDDGNGTFTARIAVTDTGIGIPADRQDKLFKKFQQADDSTARKYGGTGLGLAISKNLAELMGGGISLQSAEGKGATFTVSIPFPIAAAEAVKDNRNIAGAAIRIEKSARILVVDDHPINRLFMRRTLEMLGFEQFDEAAAGAEAVALSARTRYDLILMDCQMPDMDGYEASRRIRSSETQESRSVIVAVTANAMKGAEEKCRAAGMDDYISKPVDKEKLTILLQRWLPGGGVEDGEAGNPPVPHPVPVAFDWHHLSEYTRGDRETETRLINMFLDSLREDIGNLQQGFHSNDFEQWESAAHKLHGASAHMGACALAQICDEAQSLAPEEPAKMKEIHRLILAETHRLHGILEEKSRSA